MEAREDTYRQIESPHYGTLTVPEREIYRFENGLIGLPQSREFALVPFQDTPFYLLHAIEGGLSFVVMPPSLAVENYEFEIPDELAELLGLRFPDQALTFVIVNIVDDRPCVNLKAPIILVPGSRKACQYILHDKDFPIRYPLGKESSTCSS